jgi:hypothetical protein
MPQKLFKQPIWTYFCHFFATFGFFRGFLPFSAIWVLFSDEREGRGAPSFFGERGIYLPRKVTVFI